MINVLRNVFTALLMKLLLKKDNTIKQNNLLQEKWNFKRYKIPTKYLVRFNRQNHSTKRISKFLDVHLQCLPFFLHGWVWTHQVPDHTWSSTVWVHFLQVNGAWSQGLGAGADQWPGAYRESWEMDVSAGSTTTFFHKAGRGERREKIGEDIRRHQKNRNRREQRPDVLRSWRD